MQHRDFALLWSGQLASMLGTWMQTVVMAWHVLQLTDSPFNVGLLGLMRAAPVIVFSVVGGAVADTMDRRRLIVVTQSISMSLTGILALLTSADVTTVWMIYAIAFLAGISSSFDTPARQALAPSLVPRTHINNAVTLILVIRHAGLMIGPPIGGFVIAAFGLAAAYWVNVSTFAFLIAAVLAIRARSDGGGSRPRMELRTIAEGMRYMWAAPIVLSVLGIDFFSTLFGAARSTFPTFARDVFHAGPQGFGFLTASPAVGGLLGVAAALALGDVRRKGVGVILCTGGFGLANIGFALAPSLSLACVGLGLYGFVDAIGDSMRHTLLQTETPDELRGRVNSVAIMLGNGGPNLGQLWLGFLATALGPREGVALGGAVIALFALSLGLLARPLIRYGRRAAVAPLSS